MTSPQLTEQPATQPVESCSYWPVLKKAMLSNETPETLVKGTCPICLDDISIAGLPAPTTDEENGDGQPLIGKLTLCGHVFCRPCFDAVLSQRGPRKCPSCRMLLECSRCSAPARNETVPWHGTDPLRAAQIPLTTAEGGTHVGLCGPCNGRRRWLANIRAGDYPPRMLEFEPGVIPFLYTTIEAIENHGLPVTPDNLVNAFRTIVTAEFDEVVGIRDNYIRSSRNPPGGWLQSHETTARLARLPGYNARRMRYFGALVCMSVITHEEIRM
ncbi:hypothetical protein G7046_g8396 [Stylonectria norvegica]|nr:hypothetical protein G7046_g8396 [Stylonectria norvegica]